MVESIYDIAALKASNSPFIPKIMPMVRFGRFINEDIKNYVEDK
ncbi:hypothetical protein PULV_b0883 [Pseudoalteromonas ulvae UL12]|nr:hypothetical protein [Pseudoalteromonas ulvae UL12]